MIRETGKSISSFIFHGSLTDFIKKSGQNPTTYVFTGKPSVKDAFESLGIPHPEVARILRNGLKVDFSEHVFNGDKFELFPFSPDFFQKYLSLKFILDVHLGKLTHKLRMLGFDCYYNTVISKSMLLALSINENRTLLTRDSRLLMNKSTRNGYFIRSENPEIQLKDVIHYFSLCNDIHPFTRCLRCNGLLEEIKKEIVEEKIQPKTKIYFHVFHKCRSCQKIYWQGSHFTKMKAEISSLCK
jgi:uncharacterized protein